jgi:ATP-dependent helicase/nuclease subunit A
MDDGAALLNARAAMQRWSELVDRRPPAELLDMILDESAYTLELRGSRFRQARENLKKVRALIRRIQNRGYATMSRIAAHLDRLAVGDESNAAIDALDAVNLMTVHAAKGLEFPVVFLVNLARGTGNRRDPIRVVGTPAGASVAAGDFRSEADADESARDLEETKRLLYVAMTRARDRLYLASALKDHRIQPGRGSLAEVLPPSLLEKFGEAMTERTIQWRARSGTVHQLWVPRKQDQFGISSTSLDDGSWESGVEVRDDFGPLEDRAASRMTVAAATVGETDTFTAHDTRKSERLVGVLVHRLLQRAGFTPDIEASLARDLVDRLLRPDERVSVGDVDELMARAIAGYRAIAGHRDVREIYVAGEPLHEVPFSMVVDGVIVRGSIDCLVESQDRLTVLEFKTGRRYPGHDEQLDLYRKAAEAMFPGRLVVSRIVYADEIVSPP